MVAGGSVVNDSVVETSLMGLELEPEVAPVSVVEDNAHPKLTKNKSTASTSPSLFEIALHSFLIGPMNAKLLTKCRSLK